MSDTTHCKVCTDPIWWEESNGRSCWVSKMNGPMCSGAGGKHEPENDESLHFPRPVDARMITAELLVVAYINENGENSYMTHARGDMPASTYLGLTVLAQDDIKEWGKNANR